MANRLATIVIYVLFLVIGDGEVNTDTTTLTDTSLTYHQSM